MEILQKNAHLSSIWLQSTSPKSSAPSAYSQGPVPNCWGSMQNGYNKAPTVTAPENTQPLCDLEMFDLGGFGPRCMFLPPH